MGVEDAKLRGRLRVTLRPLLRRVPVVGAVQVSLVEQPEFDFDITLVGRWGVMTRQRGRGGTFLFVMRVWGVDEVVVIGRPQGPSWQVAH